LTGNGSNRCSQPELLHRGDRRRMDEQFTDVCGHLDRENPAVVIAKPAAHSLKIGDMKVRGSVILVENLVPAVRDLNALPTENWPEELDFEDMRAHAPKIKEAVRASMNKKVVTKSPTSTSGKGDAGSLLNVSDSAIPVVRTAQLVVASRRVRQTVLRYSSPR
jgi:hypothetical protein